MAIAAGLHAKPAQLKPYVAEDFTMNESQLLQPWLRIETGDKSSAQQSVADLITELESSVVDELALLSSFEVNQSPSSRRRRHRA